MPEYAAAVVVAVALTLAYERWVLRSGLFRSRHVWVALGICLFFMVLTNGWLTKLSAPIVQYDPDAKTPWRFPWDIPIEDFGFGFALLVVVLARWIHAGRNQPVDEPHDAAGGDERATDLTTRTTRTTRRHVEVTR